MGLMRRRRWAESSDPTPPMGRGRFLRRLTPAPGAAGGPSVSGQARSGIARSRARAVVQPTAQGQRAGR